MSEEGYNKMPGSLVFGDIALSVFKVNSVSHGKCDLSGLSMYLLNLL